MSPRHSLFCSFLASEFVQITGLCLIAADKFTIWGTIIVEGFFRISGFKINGSIILPWKPKYMDLYFFFIYLKSLNMLNIYGKRYMHSNLDLQDKCMTCKSLFILIYAVGGTCVHQTMFITWHKYKFIQSCLEKHCDIEHGGLPCGCHRRG